MSNVNDIIKKHIKDYEEKQQKIAQKPSAEQEQQEIKTNQTMNIKQQRLLSIMHQAFCLSCLNIEETKIVVKYFANFLNEMKPIKQQNNPLDELINAQKFKNYRK